MGSNPGYLLKSFLLYQNSWLLLSTFLFRPKIYGWKKICLFSHFSNFGKSSCFWVNIKCCDQIKGDNLQDLASTESPKDIVLNITDPSDKPGSILTTLIDGFLLPKQPSQPDIDTGNDEKDSSVASLSDVDSESVKETVGGFPVTNILRLLWVMSDH